MSSKIQTKQTFVEGDKVLFQGKVYDFGYLAGRGDYCVLYEEGERNMQDSVSVPLYNVSHAPTTTQAEAGVERRVDYFDSEEVREHVRESKHCQHGLGFTYDFCPIVNQVNQHEHLQQRIAELEAVLVRFATTGNGMLSLGEYQEWVQSNARAVLNEKEGEW